MFDIRAPTKSFFLFSQAKETELITNLKACKEKLKSLGDEENKHKGERVEFDKVIKFRAGGQTLHTGFGLFNIMSSPSMS